MKPAIFCCFLMSTSLHSKKKKKRSFDNDELIITYRDKNFEQDSIQGYFHYSKVED